MKNNLWMLLVFVVILVMGKGLAMAVDNRPPEPVMGAGSAAGVDNTPPEPAITAAQEAISGFLGNAEQEELQKFGFNNQKELENASIGDVFRVHLLHPDTVLNTKNASSLFDIADHSKIYQFVLYNGQAPACMITVEYIDNQWIAVSVSGAGLARQLHEIIETWPGSKGYTHVLIRSLQAKADFVEIYQNAKQIGIVPLISAEVAIGKESRKKDIMLRADEILEGLTPVVIENLRQ